jgi:uncharacterized protein (DUF488 family)
VKEAAPEILTVGHSTHPIDHFIELLRSAGVETIADVRRYPGSRRHPHFGADSLAASLSEAGIDYESFGEQLGGRRRAAKGRQTPDGVPDNSAWRNPSFRAYADYMSEPAFAAGLDRLQSLGRERRTAVMCAEAHPSRCHRQLIADALHVRGWHVLHLLSDRRTASHSLSVHAHASGEQVSYPGPPQLDL